MLHEPLRASLAEKMIYLTADVYYNLSRNREKTTNRTMSGGDSRELNGVPVRSLKVRRHCWHLKVWSPRLVFFACFSVSRDVQEGQFIGSVLLSNMFPPRIPEIGSCYQTLILSSDASTYRPTEQVALFL
jgi:hypothetical protein